MTAHPALERLSRETLCVFPVDVAEAVSWRIAESRRSSRQSSANLARALSRAVLGHLPES